jgi:hypothetical protein
MRQTLEGRAAEFLQRATTALEAGEDLDRNVEDEDGGTQLVTIKYQGQSLVLRFGATAVSIVSFDEGLRPSLVTREG